MRTSTRKKRSREERITATHEAGHAVAALALRIPLSRVTIIATGDYRGCTTTKKAWRNMLTTHSDAPDHWAECAQADIVYAFAGRLAEEVLLGHRGAAHAHDDKCIHELIWRLREDPNDGVALANILKSRAMDLVRRERQAINAVADALLERRQLSSRAVAAIAAPLMQRLSPG